MTILGRQAELPPGPAEWVQLAVVLIIVAVTFAIASGWPAAVLGTTAAMAGYLYDHHLFLPFAVATAGCLALITGKRANIRSPGQRAIREALFIGTGFALYEFGRSLVVGTLDEATRNANRVVNVETRLGLWIEEPLQRYVIQHHGLVLTFNKIYSFAFLTFVLGTIFYLYITNESAFRVYRNSLGISALLAFITIAVFPLAPPRHFPGSGMVDTHDLVGKAHGFVNEFAAMPSLHVGWMALAGFMLFSTTKSWFRWFWLLGPSGIMLLTVMVTGNHYWLDGALGAFYTLTPAVILMRRSDFHVEESHVATTSRRFDRRFKLPSPSTASPKTRFTYLSLGSLFTYLIVRQIIDPGFTDYWGYMVAQIGLTLIILPWVNEEFSAEGGLSWFTHGVVVVNAWADCLGTAAHMYERYVSYDKFTHFLGGVMLTAAAADIIFALNKRRGISTPPFKVLSYAVAISVGIGAAWELYEFLGDRLFDTGRHAGSVDTVHDLISDTVGSLVSAAILWRWRQYELGEPVAEVSAVTNS